MIEFVQALATLEADPTQADALGRVAAQGKVAAQGSAEVQSAAKTALFDSMKRCRERGDAELWLALCDVALDSGLYPGAAERADLLCEKGRVYADDLLRDSEAAEAFNAALKLQDEHEAAQDALSQIGRAHV